MYFMCLFASLVSLPPCPFVLLCHDEASDAFASDTKMMADILDGTLKDEIANTSQLLGNVIKQAATTRLEFQMMNALINLDKNEAAEEVRFAEREFSTKFRFSKDKEVHAAILKKKAEHLK